MVDTATPSARAHGNLVAARPGLNHPQGALPFRQFFATGDNRPC
jgi:hypothetical protein